MKLCFISDTHGYHEDVKIDPCDILIHSGDCTRDAGRRDLREFLQWLERQPARIKVLIAGNHDWALEKWPDLAQAMIKEVAPSVVYLQDSGSVIMGLKFWGSPVTKRFYDWAFNRDPGEDIKRHWDMIPDDTDVLVTHGPPFGFLDQSNNWSEATGSKWTDHLGCNDLLDAVKRVTPKLHCFGHIHGSGGKIARLISEKGYSTLVNAAILDEAYIPTHKPVYLDL